jgi:hypothetical protein
MWHKVVWQIDTSAPEKPPLKRMDLNIYLSDKCFKKKSWKEPEIYILCSVICSIGPTVHKIIKIDYIISSYNSRKFGNIL